MPAFSEGDHNDMDKFYKSEGEGSEPMKGKSEAVLSQDGDVKIRQTEEEEDDTAGLVK